MVASTGRPALTRFASASICSSSTPTWGARSILLTTRRSQRSRPGPFLRGISSPPATSMTKIHQSTRSSEKVEARLSPPDSNRISSSPGNRASRSSPAAMFKRRVLTDHRMRTGAGFDRRHARRDRSGRSGAAVRHPPWSRDRWLRRRNRYRAAAATGISTSISAVFPQPTGPPMPTRAAPGRAMPLARLLVQLIEHRVHLNM